ncbi:hypothetical protein ES288_A02G040300v1 [Gossypium darwinii]|uniref:Bifunctional inhibitor/plant lipid transfer protein/seed storage helical domain-containing protein n=1 Tax=Gossypium darwinii TaxID=34276 RepID=A0A5D2HAB4_GOSDA|nr:hypothetical protein ES288_A02G040300v1 [Gossypium darwinii]
MALGKITLVQGLALVMVTLLWAGTMAQSDCTSVLITMAPCVDYVTGTSSTPSVPCCSQLANVVQLQPHCLCMAFSGGSSLGVEVNQTLALALPQLCHVKTPPESSCKAADGPAVISISPSSSPQGLPPHPNDTAGSNSSTSEQLQLLPVMLSSTYPFSSSCSCCPLLCFLQLGPPSPKAPIHMLLLQISDPINLCFVLHF